MGSYQAIRLDICVRGSTNLNGDNLISVLLRLQYKFSWQSVSGQGFALNSITPLNPYKCKKKLQVIHTVNGDTLKQKNH